MVMSFPEKSGQLLDRIQSTLQSASHECGASVVHLFQSALDSLDTGDDPNLDHASALVELSNESLLLYPYKNVPQHWRQLLMDASLIQIASKLRQMVNQIDQPLCQTEPVAMEIVATVDTAIVVSGAPGRDRRAIALDVADTVQDWLTTSRKKPRTGRTLGPNPWADTITISRPIPRLATLPGIMEFAHHVENVTTPFILPRGAIDHWPAMTAHLWSSSDYLLSVASDRVVPVEIGHKYTDSTWHQDMMRFEDFVNNHILVQEGPPVYLAQHNLFHQIPRLANDIDVPEYCLVEPSLTESYPIRPANVIQNAWFGPKGTVSPLHHDPYHNLLAQVVGEKYIRLYAPMETEKLYPTPGLLSNTSQVDAEDPDLEQFPLFADANYTECILRPGELLYIPPTWWHYVRSLDTSFSISFWF